jgi:cytochrome c biogenesis protein CcdA
MALGSLAFAFAAGTLSVLSPCVLPILPVVLGAAAAEHRLGTVALAAGVALAFTALGLFLATAGFSLGLDQGPFRALGAVMLAVFGLVLLVPSLDERFTNAASWLSSVITPVSTSVSGAGLGGQFVLGLTLGLVWSPCAGPTLGAASLVAARGQELPQVGATMAVFAIGATLPLIGLGQLTRRYAARRRGALLAAGQRGKSALGAVLLVAGVMIVSGLDTPLEGLLVAASPSWLAKLSTSF